MVFLVTNDSVAKNGADNILRLCGELLMKMAGCRAGVLMTVDASGKVLASISIGDAGVDIVGRTQGEIDLLARQAPRGDCVFKALAPCHTLVQRYLGDPPPPLSHGVAGRVCCSCGIDLAIIAGWRAEELAAGEAELLERVGASMRDSLGAALKAAGGEAARRPPAGFDIFNSVVSPVFRVDERMAVTSMNDAARREIDEGDVLQEVGGRLVSASGSCDELRNAVRRALRDVPVENGRASIVPLATDASLPRFAIVAPSPVRCGPPAAVIVLPAVDGDEGARRLASLYGLTQAEKKVVRLVLTGVTPVAIAGRLSLTEATVRTYLKRIMLKLGINRRSEFFLLYILTMSPLRLTPEPECYQEMGACGAKGLRGRG